MSAHARVEDRRCICCRWLHGNFATLKLLGQPLEERVFYPRIYLSASHELFVGTLFVAWIWTLLFHSEQVFEHPVRPIIGSFNPCYGWDYAPASWFSVVVCSMNVLLTWRYSWLQQTRSIIQNPEGRTVVQQFSKFSAILLALSSNVWQLLWVIGPVGQEPGQPLDKLDVNKWFVHTGIFLLYAAASYLSALAYYLEATEDRSRDNVAKRHTVFIIVYGCTTGYLAFVYLVNWLTYEKGSPPTVFPLLTQVADVVFLASALCITSFLPEELPLKVTTEVLDGPPPTPPPQERLCQSSWAIERAVSHVCTCPRGLTERFAIFKLLSQPLEERVFYPSVYLSASHEVFVGTLVFTWAWTWNLRPDQILDHPARPLMGSYSPFFGWDYAPASWFAMVACSMNVLLTWRYSWLQQTRSIIRNPEGRTVVQQFGKFSAILLALASHLFQLLWVIGPVGQEPGQPLDKLDVNKWFLHTGIFFTYAAASYLCALANYLEAAEDRSQSKALVRHTAFVIVYGCSLACWAFVCFCNLAMYDEDMPPNSRTLFKHTAEVAWIACMCSASSFLPVESPLQVNAEVVADLEQVEFVTE